MIIGIGGLTIRFNACGNTSAMKIIEGLFAVAAASVLVVGFVYSRAAKPSTLISTGIELRLFN